MEQTGTACHHARQWAKLYPHDHLYNRYYWPKSVAKATVSGEVNNSHKNIWLRLSDSKTHDPSKCDQVYKKFGIDDLWCSRQNNFYSFELKLNAVELYLSDEASSQELAFTLEWISFDLCRTAQCWLVISILTSGSSLMKSKTNTRRKII